MADHADNISAGTQVVSRVEVRGTNHSLVHPRGAVGVVTRTPAGEEEHFLVRFPDGFEFSLLRDQMEILKHFKARLGATHTHSLAPIGGEGQGEGASAANPAFNLESLILYRCVVGSRAYGLDHDESDTDRRGIYLAPADLQWSLFGAPEQFEDHATQSCYWELQKFLIMALKANPNILECLYSPLVEKVTLLRTSATLREACVPVRAEAHRDRLLTVKRGELPWTDCPSPIGWERVPKAGEGNELRWRKELHHEFERALAETKLPERPDYDLPRRSKAKAGAANCFLVKARSSSAADLFCG